MDRIRLSRFLPFLILSVLGVLIALFSGRGYFLVGLALTGIFIFYAVWKTIGDEGK